MKNKSRRLRLILDMIGGTEMKNKKKILQIILAFIIIFNLTRLPIPYRVKFDKDQAEVILREAYGPLEDFIRAGIPTEDEELLLVPDNIKGEEDFIKLFDKGINNHNHVVRDFFQDIVLEKEGDLYINKKAYIPTIYQKEDSLITKAYIKEYTRSLYSYILGRDDKKEEELVIKEKWKITGEWFRRSNYFSKNSEGRWVLDYFSGSRAHDFVEVEHNPWYYN